MARIFDVVEYPSEMADEIVHRFPETGVADLRIGSQIIVRESQRVVFFRDGNALDTFGPGRHTIVTANIPKLIDFIAHRLPLKSIMYPSKSLLIANGAPPSPLSCVILVWAWAWRFCKGSALTASR